MNASPGIGPFIAPRHRAGVIALWRATFHYGTPHNEPELALQKKLEVDDQLLFVASDEQGHVTGTAMGGYDGHRGWIYSVAVAEGCRRRGLGTRLVKRVETALRLRGCLKINLQVAAGNESNLGFYENLGYAVEPRISLGKVVVENLPQ